MRLKIGALALLGTMLAAPAAFDGQTAQGQTGNVVHYTTTIANVKYVGH